MPPSPRYPIYIPSWSRAEHATTPAALDRLGLTYRLVVQADQYDAYRQHWSADHLLVLDPWYQETYEALGDFSGKQLGPGPVRNFAWDHARGEGWPWFWTMDDNIRTFYRFHRNQRIQVADGAIFAAMEDFCARYSNVAMAGPAYYFDMPSRLIQAPIQVNGRIFSCQLHRTNAPFRYRGRYNDDVILTLDMLKAGWCTILFYAFLQGKARTQTVPGGCHQAFYAEEGTLAKSQMLVDAHPDVARVVKRYGRWHHHVDYHSFNTKLICDPRYQPSGRTWQFEQIAWSTPYQWLAKRRETAEVDH